MENNKILPEMYDRVLEELPGTKKYHKLMRQFEEEEKKFLDNIEEQNAETLEKLLNIKFQADDEMDKQIFAKGFIIAFKLFMELIYEEKGDI